MDKEFESQLAGLTEDLRTSVRRYSSLHILTRCAILHREGTEKARARYGLLSPYKQSYFLLGIMLSTPEPPDPLELEDAEWNHICELLAQIFEFYITIFFPKREELPTLTAEWWEYRGIAMPAFIHYYNTGLIATSEQVTERIEGILLHFDSDLESLVGLSAGDAVQIVNWLIASMQAILDKLPKAYKAAEDAHGDFARKVKEEGWDWERLKLEAQHHPVKAAAENYFELLGSMWRVRFSDLCKSFGEKKASAFWELFVSRRGKGKALQYITDENPSEAKPLFLLEEGEAFCPMGNPLYGTILDRMFDSLLGSPRRDAALRIRGKFLERQAESLLVPFFGSEARCFAGCFEKQNRQLEHDLIIHWQRQLYLIESKASPPRQPVTDPEKTFLRIKDHFRGEGGIQKAYDQANRLRKRLALGEVVELFDEDGKSLDKIDPKCLDDVFCICVTAEDFGFLAVDLSLLLSKDPSEQFPWAVNIYDLQTFLGGLNYRAWGPERFTQFLKERCELHGKVICSDELEIGGIFLGAGSLDPLLQAKVDKIVVAPESSNIFDDIYLEKHGGKKVEIHKYGEFDFLDLGGELRKKLGLGEEPRTVKGNIKVGRNEKCPCGSGKKFKKCCGR